MQYSTVLLSALTLALAQAKIAFTTLPSSVEAGKPVTLKWTGGDDGPVTITLKKGDSNDLQTVSVITGNADGESFTWTPSSSLPNGDTYALQISQGVSDVNYSGQFTLSGGSSSSDSSSSSSASGYPISSVSSTAYVSTTVETTVTAVNSTTRAHTVYATGTAPPASISGTGINVTRNTTFSSATPTRSRSAVLSAGTTGASSTSADSTGAATSAAASETASQGAASHIQFPLGAGFAALLGFAALF